jgi:hypothetical protein
MSTAKRARPLAPAASRSWAVRPVPAERRIVEGRITAVLPDGRVKLVTRAGANLSCRCPQHVSIDWLRAAVAVGPVEAEASTNGRTGTIWCLLPGPEHRAVAPDTLHLAARESLKIACGESTLSLDKEGTVRLRGRDVTTRGSRVTRLQGGTVRIN